MPDSFDVRTIWPQCSSVSGHIQDQSSCGSCWAVGCTEVFNDRRCIATGDTTLMSVEDTTPKLRILEVLFYGLQRCSARAGLAVVQEYWRRHWRRLHGHRLRNNLCAVLAGPVRSPRGAIHQVSGVPELRVLHSVSACTELLSSASYSLSIVHGIQQDMMQYGSVTGAFTVYVDFATIDFDNACVTVCARMRTFSGTACVKMAMVGDCGSWRNADSLG